MAAMHEMTDPEPMPEMVLQDEGHLLRFRQQLLILLEEKQFSDVVLKSNGGKEFPCHRVVLAAGSSYFKAMFNSGMMESRSPKVELEEMDSDILSSLINYIYSGSLKITADNAQRLVESIKPLDFPEIIKGCEDFMIQEVCPTNCLGFKRFAGVYELERLKEAAVSIMRKEFQQVVRSAEFGELSADELIEYILDSKLKVKTEDPIFAAVRMWLHMDRVNREPLFPRIAARIRFPYCSKNYLSSVVVPCPYMSNPQCASYLQEAWTFHMLPEQRSRMCSPRLEQRQDFHSSGALVIFGGVNNDGTRSLCDAYKCPITDTWKPINKFAKVDLRNYAVVAFQSGILVTGGDEHGELKKDCFFYDLSLQEWRDMPSLREGRSCHGSVSQAGHVYVLGGNLLSGPGKSMEVYSKVPKLWTSVSAMPKALIYPLVVSYGQYIFVTSGKDQASPSVSTMAYDTVWDRWEYRKDMPKPVHLGSITAVQDKFYIVGGVLPSCLSYDVEQDAWTVLTPPNYAHASAATFVQERVIKIWGGKDATNGSVGTLECYDVKTDTWTLKDAPLQRSGHHMVYVNLM